MKYEKLIGFKLDTNQFTSPTIKSDLEAKSFIEKVVNIYGKEILQHMFLTNDKRYTLFKKDGVSLFDVLN